MRHLKIQHIGHLNVVRPSWPMQRYSMPTDSALDLHYDSEPILQVEIDETSWKQMYQLYEDHLTSFKHPAVRDAWEQYLMMKAMTKAQK